MPEEIWFCGRFYQAVLTRAQRASADKNEKKYKLYTELKRNVREAEIPEDN